MNSIRRNTLDFVYKAIFDLSIMPRSSPPEVEDQAEATFRNHDNYEELSMIGNGITTCLVL